MIVVEGSMIEPKSKLWPGAVEHNLSKANFLQRMIARVHYEQVLEEHGKRKWFEYFGMLDEDRIYMVETAKLVLKELEKVDSTIKIEDHISRANLQYLTNALFDSAVNSGDFILLSNDLRKKISSYYTTVHLANNQVSQLIQSQFIVTEDSEKLQSMRTRMQPRNR